MESGGEVGSHPFGSSGVGEGDLHHVEVSNGPRNGKVHGLDIVYKELPIIDGYVPLAIGYIQKGY